MTNDKHESSQQAIQEAFNERLKKASKEEVHTLCIGDFQEKKEKTNSRRSSWAST